MPPTEGEVICCKPTASFAKRNSPEQFNFVSLGGLKLKGFERPVNAYRVDRNSGFSFADTQPPPVR